MQIKILNLFGLKNKDKFSKIITIFYTKIQAQSYNQNKLSLTKYKNLEQNKELLN